MEIVSGPVGFERKPSGGFESLDFLKVEAAGDGLKSKASARPSGMRGPALRRSHRSNRKKKECCFIFCLMVLFILVVVINKW